MKDIYRGKLALVSGGSSGIGLEVVKNLFQQGCSIIILARNEEKLDFAKTSLTSQSNTSDQYVWTYSVDVTDYSAVQAVADTIINSIGLPDFIFNFAGVARPGYVEELPIEVFKWTMDIDFHGTVHVVKAFLPALIKRGSGHIINVSSLAGAIGIFGYTAYSGAKYAVRGFTDVLRSELKPKGIDVSIVFPPDTDTPQLAWENQYKPPETAIIAGSDKPLPASYVAEIIVRDVAKNKYQIVPGLEAKLLHWLGTHMGGIVYPVIDILVASAIKKVKTTRNKE